LSAILRVVEPGPLVTVQDRGRPGWQRIGVTPAGAIDPVSFAVANALVGNPLDAAALEFTLIGGIYAAEEGPLRIAVVGPAFPVAVDGAPIAPLTSFVLQPGQRLRIGSAAADAVGGARGYLAVHGGLDTPLVLGSRSTHVRSGFGGLEGRALKAGDRLPVQSKAIDGAELKLDPALLPAAPHRLRIVLGPQDDYFTVQGIETFLSADFTVSTDADRMGYRLAGPVIEHRDGFNIVSDGVGIGAIQVPGNGQPIVLLADRQSTGGYPKIAGVISVDLAFLAQKRPGDQVRFEAIDIIAAQALARERAAFIHSLPTLIKPAVVLSPSAEDLLSVNLISGMVVG
jgi:biotin-dependent carboxylase-like uncharacterized protein